MGATTTMTPEHVHLGADSDDLLDGDAWRCEACGHLWPSLAAAQACEVSDDAR